MTTREDLQLSLDAYDAKDCQGNRKIPRTAAFKRKALIYTLRYR